MNLLQSMLGIGTAHADTLKERLQASGMSGAAASHLTDAALALNGPRSLDSSKRASAAMAAAVTAIAPLQPDRRTHPRHDGNEQFKVSGGQCHRKKWRRCLYKQQWLPEHSLWRSIFLAQQ